MKKLLENFCGWISYVLRSYKSYLLFILIPYVFLILMFHTQLQTYDIRGKTNAANRMAILKSHGQFGDQNYHVRNLRLNNVSGVHSTKDVRLGNGMGGIVRRGGENLQRKPLRPSRPSLLMAPSPHAFIQHGNILVEANLAKPALQSHKANIPIKASQQDIPPYKGSTEHQNHTTWKTYHTAWLSNHKQSSLPVADSCRHSLKSISYIQFQPIIGSFIYSAFYDDRQDEGKPVLRIISLLKKLDKPAMFCHFEVSDNVYSAHIATYYEMCENHAKDYGGWILTCDVPSKFKTKPPCNVIVSLHSTYNKKDHGNIEVPVFVLSRPTVKKEDFGVCVPPLFGYIPSTTLIEFIELTKILGAQHINFYAYQLPLEIRKVLLHYEKEGLITVIPWDLPVADNKIWYHGQLLAINDCLYRNMHRFKYLAFNDIDEFIVPHKHDNWTSMMEYVKDFSLTNPKRHCGYSFQSAFFDPLLSGTERALYDLESDLRSKSFSKVRSKVIVIPELIHELGIHHISKPVFDVHRPEYVEPSVAFLHHYRKCVTDFDPKMNCQVYARDESLSQYIPTLRHNVHHAMWVLKENEKKHSGKMTSYHIR